jgi:hypothetical protein
MFCDSSKMSAKRRKRFYRGPKKLINLLTLKF